jgi:rhodanese-related sulfurtransferase
VTVHPPDHAGYYPGASPMTLKVSFARADGALLGAQAVGDGAVDKRIDVLATAMRAGMKITDLEHLELAYAPPYGSAKDAVNMAGFAGSNVLRGAVRIVHAEDFAVVGAAGPSSSSSSSSARKWNLEEYQVVDVRSAEEFARGHIRGAKNVPIAELRERIGELDPARKTVVYCWVGYRGYLAYRVLVQSGFGEVWNLDGGFKAVSEGGFHALEERAGVE